MHSYALRKRGLDEALTLEELGRALYRICRRRGSPSTALPKHKRLEAFGLRVELKEAVLVWVASNRAIVEPSGLAA